MDKAYIDRHLVTDRYLQGTLSQQATAEFEERLTWDTELLEELELAEQLREGLRESAASGGFTARPSSPGMIAAIWSTPRYAAAASFVLAVMLTSVIFVNIPEKLDGGASAETDIVPLVAVRSAAAARVEVRPRAVTVLLVDASDGYPAYRAELHREGHGSEIVWQKSGLSPTYPESLAISLPPGFLTPGRYVLAVDGQLTNASGDTLYERVREIPFEVYVPPSDNQSPLPPE